MGMPPSFGKLVEMGNDRLAAFESMLAEIQKDHAFKSEEIERLKSQGKEKTATFKQYLSDKLLYQRMLSLYEKHSLL